MGKESPPKRTVRSFVRRQGRMTTGQKQAKDLFWSKWGIDFTQQKLDLPQIFANQKPVILEIGFGMGEALLHIAEGHPEKNFMGIDVHQPGVGAVLQGIHEQQLSNVRVCCGDAIELLTHSLAPAALAGIHLFFPDPWHKTRHHKRRIVNRHFLDLVHKVLTPGGYLHMATDWQDYATHMLAEAQQHTGFINQSPTADYIARPDSRPLTKFEQRGLRLGHGIWDLLFQKQ